jgi:hypothetical protein
MSLKAAAGPRGVFASICDIWNFPTGGMWSCRPMWRLGRGRAVGARVAALRLENNFARQETARVLRR